MSDPYPAFLDEIAASVDGFLSRYLQAVDLPDKLRKSIEYALLGGGKRLRPCLIILCCEAVGGRREVALGPAAAMELIHAFSLVHDDLPAMDDDDLRRGRPTLHIHAGEALAILAGDAMMPLAFSLIYRTEGLSAKATHRLIRELAEATLAMIAGQVYDTLGGFPEGLSSRDRLDLIHRNKTGALMRAACRMGAICGRAGEETLDAITRYGEAVGLMFQVVDDLLDVTQSTEHLGKAAGKDREAGKLTFPGLLGIPASREEVRRLRDEAVMALEPLGKAAGPLRDLCNYLAVRTK
ncbi:MAG: polyprenyl synthetase family protein [Phycisphaerales bacterium]|nr:MAG: polyprenyl synthetase family protein [Phycisphaerales bacterium]